MDTIRHTKASFNTLPLEILELIAMNLDLPDYLQFRAISHQMWDLFGCGTLTPKLKDIKALDGEKLEQWYEDCQLKECHYISQGHILSYAYRKNGMTSGLDILTQRGASLKYITCGDIVERAARSNDYERQLSWLISHGASFREVRGGINRLCREYYDKSEKSHNIRHLERYSWLFQKGASLDILSQTVSRDPGRSGPRSPQALHFHRYKLIKALRAGDLSRSHRKGLREGGHPGPAVRRLPRRTVAPSHNVSFSGQ